MFDGPVREIAPLFPRNVNTMVTCALATVGLDRCRGRMIADPALDHAVAEVEAWGKDGSYLTTVKRQPTVGVSGTEMFASTLRSVLKATGAGPRWIFCNAGITGSYPMMTRRLCWLFDGGRRCPDWRPANVSRRSRRQESRHREFRPAWLARPR